MLVLLPVSPFPVANVHPEHVVLASFIVPSASVPVQVREAKSPPKFGSPDRGGQRAID